MDGKRQRREAAEQKEKERRNKQTAILFLFIIINNPEIWAPNHEPSNPLAFSSLVFVAVYWWNRDKVSSFPTALNSKSYFNFNWRKYLNSNWH